VVDPVFWLGVSILLVAVSIAAVLVVLIPTLKELARAARSAEKLFDTLSRELPPTLESIRLTGAEISDLTDEVSEGVQSAQRVVKQVDQGVGGARKQVQRARSSTRSVLVGMRAAWQTLRRRPSPRRSLDQLPASTEQSIDRLDPRPSDRNGDAAYLDSYSEASEPEPRSDARNG
jgi:uncharacterized protein YoxC